jgi:hypothetical protein
VATIAKPRNERRETNDRPHALTKVSFPMP